METLNRALEIEGLTSAEELEWLADRASNYTHIVELGAYLGRSTYALAESTSGQVLAIDDWLGPRDVSIPWMERACLYDKFCLNVADLIKSGKVLPLRCDFGFLSNIRFGDPPDMIFIDGDHSYSSVCRDLSWSISWLSKRGGLLCGHDRSDTGVQDALRQLPHYYKGAGSIWWVELRIHYGARPHG